MFRRLLAISICFFSIPAFAKSNQQTNFFPNAKVAKQISEAEQQQAFSRTYCQIFITLSDYDRSHHNQFMKLLGNSTDLSYAMKIGLISIYDDYRKTRDSLDQEYNQRLITYAKAIARDNKELFFDIAKLSMFMDPYKTQTPYKKILKKLNTDKKTKHILHCLTKEYYKKRKEIDRHLWDKEYILISYLGN